MKTIIYILAFITLFYNVKSQTNNFHEDSTSYFVSSAQLYYKEKNYAQAIKLAIKALERDSLNEKANFVKAQSQFNSDQYKECLKANY